MDNIFALFFCLCEFGICFLRITTFNNEQQQQWQTTAQHKIELLKLKLAGLLDCVVHGMAKMTVSQN